MIEASISKRFPPGEDSAGFELQVEFTATPGITVLFGPSGSGKTLTLDSVAGFAVPDGGRIQLNGGLLFDAGSGVSIPPRNRACGYVFQNYALFPHMTVRQNLEFAGTKLPRLEGHRRIGELLDRFQLRELAGRKPRELSGGQKQRASIARALVTQPKALLLDEPARGLDGPLRAEFYAILTELRDTAKIPILLVTHDPSESFALGDQVLLFEGGRIVHRGTPVELVRNPGSVEAARLLGDFNFLAADVVAIDPARQTSVVRMFGQEFAGPHLRGCFRGDRVTLCIRPEELKVVAKPGDNRVRRTALRVTETPKAVRVDFGDGLLVDVPREVWSERPDDLWLELPASALRLLRN